MFKKNMEQIYLDWSVSFSFTLKMFVPIGNFIFQNKLSDIEVHLVEAFLPTNVPSSSPDLSITFFIGKIYLVLDVAQLKCYTSTQCK